MHCKLLSLFCFLLTSFCVAGQLPLEKELQLAYARATTDNVRIAVLGQLAEYYSAFRDNEKADSLLEKQMLLAEISQQDELIMKVLTGKVIDNMASWSSKENFERAITFLKKSQVYAREKNNASLELTASLKLAGLYRKRAFFDKAMEEATHAVLLLDKKQDSLKAVLYLELGDAFQGKGDAVSAYKNYNNAYDISYSLRNIPLQSTTWHRFARLYLSLGDSLLSKKALMESLQINTKANRKEGLFTDYTALFRQTDEIEFLHRAMAIADTLQSFADQLYCKRLMLSYIMVVEKNSSKALAYLQHNPDLQLYEKNKGLPNYSLGTIYHYGGQYAPAIRAYLLDEPVIRKQFDASVQLSLFNLIADCYQQTGDNEKAITYYETAFALGKTITNAGDNAALTQKLSVLYASQNDFKNAFRYSRLAQDYNEDLKALAKQREVTLLGLEREKKIHEKDLLYLAQEENRRRNLQYTGISMGVAFLFILMLIFGMFSVPRLGLRMLNFFAFICLFEFIILLIDNWLHHQTHGEPLKIWLAKIFIIAILLPLHHYMEHVGLKFLHSQKLMHFRKQLSIRRLWQKQAKQPLANLEKRREESTLV